MYFFEARFIDMDNEKECYFYAMEKAYDMTKKNEMLFSAEFIGC